jgi:hypothetical protein
MFPFKKSHLPARASDIYISDIDRIIYAQVLAIRAVNAQ